MLRRAVVTWLVIALAVAAAEAVVPSVEVHGGPVTLLWVALVFGLVNATLGPVLRFLSLPLTAMTLGLFAFVVNGAVLAITAGISDNLDVGGFVPAVIAALVISVVTSVLSAVTKPLRSRPRSH